MPRLGAVARDHLATLTRVSAPHPSPARAAGGSGVLRAGLAVVADAGRLVAAHWPMLLLLAMVAVVSREFLLQATVVLNRSSIVLSQLVLASTAFVQVLTVVGMLLTMRRRAAGERLVTSFLTGAAAVVLPFLVIYEHYGYLAEDVLAYRLDTVYDLADPTTDVTTRYPQLTSAAVLGTILAAFVLRYVFSALVRRTSPDRQGRRSLLRLTAGYCEVVWLVLAAQTLASIVGNLADWWHSRRLGSALDAWWQSVTAPLPSLGAAVETLAGWGGALVGAAVAGVVVPLAWLAVGAIIYGAQTERMLTAADLRIPGRMIERVGDARVTRALAVISDPERQFGGVVGASALIARAGWTPVLVFCLAFLVADQLGTLLVEVARLAVGPREISTWIQLWTPLELLGTVLVRIATLALVASAVDALLRSLGLPGGLRLRSAERQGEVRGSELVVVEQPHRGGP